MTSAMRNAAAVVAAMTGLEWASINCVLAAVASATPAPVPGDERQSDGAGRETGMHATFGAARPAELTAKQLFRIFPTPMFTGVLSDLGICDRIERKLRELQRSGQGYLSPTQAVLAYMTPDNLQTLSEMKDLVDVIMEESGIILDALAIKRDSHYITNMWANIANPNRRHSMHMHPNCLLSGVVYIKTPKNCGPIVFASPRQLAKNLEPTYQEKNEFNADVFVFAPDNACHKRVARQNRDPRA